MLISNVEVNKLLSIFVGKALQLNKNCLIIMKYISKLFAILFLSISIYSQPIYTDPEFPTENNHITIILDTSQPGAGELSNYTGTIYAHTGVNTNNGNWQHVIGEWGDNQNQPALTKIGSNLYELVVGFPRQFYSVIDPNEHINQLALVFRSADGSLQTRPDIFVDIYEPGLNIIIENPEVSDDLGDPQRSPAFVKFGSTIEIKIRAAEIGTLTSSLTLYVNNIQVEQSFADTLSYDFNYYDYPAGPHDVLAVGLDTAGVSDSSSFIMFVNPIPIDEAPPSGVEPGLTINSATSVTFMLFAPFKEFVYLIGDFNDWKVQTDYYMKRWATGPDEIVWWLTVDSISVGIEYGYQYFVDGELRIADAYGNKILDPWNDQWITPDTYPNLKPYPVGKTDFILTTFQTGLSPYPWQITDFEKPPIEKLVIYELLIRDFLDSHDYKTLKDTLSYLKSLGVNAIELMPVMEFSGNNSWGYNPIYHLALDKYYGPPNDFKSFIDSAHANGIAVILDMVLNHIDFVSSIALLYWDWNNNRPAANNPWLNQAATHPFSVFNDFNHESEQTKYYVDRVNRYWIEEYMIDGYRFDLSKGFTQTFSSDNAQMRLYDQSRIDIIERMADSIWAFDSTAYVILEHFAENSEETVLSDAGMLSWGNMNNEYNEATMGYDSDLTETSFLSRGWDVPHLVSYMESHDEERLMFKNLTYGNSSGNYNIKNFPIAIQRIKLAAAFYFTIPGAKMIWQFCELGYDFSINYPCMTDDCRTDPKPIRWDYYDDGNRNNLYKVFQALIELKKNYSVFDSPNHTMRLNFPAKRLTILDSTMNVNVIGNFDVTSTNINPAFPNTGWWYDFFSGDSIFVTNVNDLILLAPGEFHIYSTVKLPTPEDGILSDVERVNDEVAKTYQLIQNYPNPFNPSTTIGYSILNPDKVSIKIYDVLGREVKTLVNEFKENGNYQVIWNGENNFGHKVNSGIYFYRIEADLFVDTKKMILLK